MKLKVGAANDQLELEADSVADRMMRMPAPAISVTPALPQISRKCTACEEEEGKQVQKKAVGGPRADAAEATSIVHEVLRSPGQPLDAATRSYFEPRFGHDFSRVRVYTDRLAAQSAEAVGAQAYTVGSDMVFGSGRYAPASRDGQQLLAHELTHVVQQNMEDTSAPVVRRQQKRAPQPEPVKTSEGEKEKSPDPTAKALARIKNVDLLIIRPKVAWRRVGNLIQYGAVAGGDNFLAVRGSASVLPGPGQLQFGFVQACLPVLTDYVEWQDRSNNDIYRHDRTKSIRDLLPRIDANSTVNPWYLPPVAPDKAGRVEIDMSDNPTGGTVVDLAPQFPSATISEACWANTFVTAFVVQLPDGSRHPLKSFWWQLHFSATIAPKGSDSLGDVRADTAVSVSSVEDGAIDPALNRPGGGPYCNEAVKGASAKIEGPGKSHVPCASLFKP